MSKSSMLRVPTALAALFCVLAAASPASADISADDVIAQMTQLNKEAVTAYQAKKFEDARKILKQALDLAPTAALEAHPITARTHIHMGIVLVGGLKQRDNGIKEFQQAIGIQTDISLTKALITPEIEDAFKEAKEVGGIKPPAPPPEPKLPPLPPPPAPAAPAAPEPEVSATGISHEPVTQGNQGSSITITATLQKDLTFDKLVLAYRPDSAADFLGREMKDQGDGRYAADIPATATLGSVVAYYIEAEDADGNPVAARGSIDNPLVVHLSGVGAPKKERDEDDDDGGTAEAPDYRYFVGVMAGTGFGWATGTGDTNADVMINPSGMALAGAAQIAPEFGYWLNDTLMLSAQLRYQVVTGTTPIYVTEGGKDRVYHTANYALALFAKATWMYGEKKLHPFFSLAAGVGRIRHVVTFSKIAHNCGPNHNETCIDTIGAGPFLVGPGAGVMYDLTESLGLIAQLNSVLGFPDFTANVDLNVGVAYQF
jgi:hypothetical protein